MVQHLHSKNQDVLQAVHDLRAPLSVLKLVLATEAILEQSKGHSSEERQKLLNSAVKRLEQIVDDLLNPLRNKQNLLSSLQELMREKKFRYQNVDLKLEVRSDLSHLDVDVLAIVRILSNFIDNSVEAKATHVTIEVRVLGARLFLSVRDNGQGIPQILLEDFRRGRIQSTKAEGHGLALHHAQRFVKLRDGRMTIRSSEQKGTRIELSFSII